MAKRTKYHHVTTQEIMKMKELEATGMKRKDIAAQIGCSPETVSYYLERVGVPRKYRGNPISPDIIEKIVELTKQHLPQDEIAEKAGVSIDTVRRYQQKANLPASNRSWVSGQYLKKPSKPVKPVETDEPVEEPTTIKEDTMVETKPGEWISVDDASIKISGKKTSFGYTISLLSGDILISTGYGADIPIDSRDLVAFGNELLDMAEKIENIKKTFAV